MDALTLGALALGAILLFSRRRASSAPAPAPAPPASPVGFGDLPPIYVPPVPVSVEPPKPTSKPEVPIEQKPTDKPPSSWDSVYGGYIERTTGPKPPKGLTR